MPQIVVVVTRTSASEGPTSGIGFSSRTMRFFSTKIAAFMRDMAISPEQVGVAGACSLRSGCAFGGRKASDQDQYDGRKRIAGQARSHRFYFNLVGAGLPRDGIELTS
ncbi:hypothetical protein D3C75_1116280 [compost metagenome]